MKSSSLPSLHGCNFISSFSVLLSVVVYRMTYLNTTEENMAISKLQAKLTNRGYIFSDA